MDARNHILEGISHLESGRWTEAIACFDHAIRLRQATPWQHDPQAAWALAAAHLNRGDALRHSGRFRDAIPAYDRAITAMAHVPLDRNPAHPDRLALAWINRATTRAETLDPDAALADFTHAESLLAGLTGAPSPRRSFLTAMLHTNRARLLLDLGQAAETLTDCAAALTALRGIPASQEITDATITARAIQCRAFALMLDAPVVDPNWIASATDAAEDALSLAAFSPSHPSLPDLVRYTARIYRVCQPHFLAEFLSETSTGDAPLAGDRALVRQMIHEILLAKVDLERRVRENPHDTPAVERELAILSNLQRMERELAGNFPKSVPFSRPRKTLQAT